MHWDFVDIGTSDFDYSTRGKVLLVEPISYYLNNIPDQPNITKANYAVGNAEGMVDIYYIPEDVLTKHNLPYHLRGCNSVGRHHRLVLSELNAADLDLSVVKVDPIELITFRKLCQLYDVTSVGTLKIDTEGSEYHIIQSVLESNISIRVIDIEVHNGYYSLNKFMSVIEEFKKHGYNYEVLNLDHETRIILKLN